MDETRGPVALLAFGHAVPPYRVEQAHVAGWMVEAFQADRTLARWLRYLYTRSGIETRYSCLPDAEYPPALSRFAPHRTLADAPTTAERMAIYKREAVPVGAAAASAALRDYAGAATRDVASVADAVTHLLVVSCTGFFAPGLDQAIARDLGLRDTVERTLIGFMGCAAAFNALRLAAQLVQADPAALVLIVCVELCSLHIQPGTDRVNLVVASLFADGAAACLVGTPTTDDRDQFVIGGFHTSLQPDSQSDMVWDIGDHGFTMHLSPQIPAHLGKAAPHALDALVGPDAALNFWAIHPGGRAIVDELATIFALTPEQMAATRHVLRNYGNMSSPTILFVLQELRAQLRRQQGADVQHGVAMAFGPGLVIEMAQLRYVPAPTDRSAGGFNEVKGAAVEHVA
jgi:predicted naringenin-chalcone synthase